MGLAVRFEDGVYIPTILCDTCHDAIEDWNGAVVTHELTDEPLQEARVYHISACDRGSHFGEGRPEDQAWDQLSDYLAWLQWNNNWGEKHDESITIEVPPSM